MMLNDSDERLVKMYDEGQVCERCGVRDEHETENCHYGDDTLLSALDDSIESQRKRLPKLDSIAERMANLEPACEMAMGLTHLIPVVRYGFFDGEWYAEVALDEPGDYSVVKKLPKAIEFRGKIYGFSGWNSDSKKAYYSTRFAGMLANIVKGRKR